MSSKFPWPRPTAEDLALLKDALRPGGTGAVSPPPPSATAWLLLEASRAAPGLVVAVADTPRAAEELCADLEALSAPAAVPDAEPPAPRPPRFLRLPASATADSTPAAARRRASPAAAGERIDALLRCLDGRAPRLLVTSLQALLEPAPPPADLRPAAVPHRVGETLDPDAFCDLLSAAAYEFEPEVLAPGQASRRGGILDVWPPADPAPARLEFFGDTLDSIRRFDPETQRSIERLRELRIPPATSAPPPGAPPAAPADYFPAETSFVWLDPSSLLAHYAMGEELASSAPPAPDAPPVWKRFANWRLGLARRFPGGGSLDVGGDPSTAGFHAAAVAAASPDGALPALEPVPFDGLPPLAGRTVPPDVLESQRRALADRLRALAASGWRVHLWLSSPAAAARHAEAYGPVPGAVLHIGALSAGFSLPRRRWLAAAESDLYGTARLPPARARGPVLRRDATGERLSDWTDLRPGELVVHVAHGIGKYLGLYEIRFDGQLQEALAVEYDGGARLYVPATQSHLLSRYVGIGRARPPLHRLGSTRWQREKDAAARAASDLAARMLETQARRDASPGHAYPPDTPWQADFEASFPYAETPDQARAIADVKRDMESARPMDRLVCGDAGYGKTEVAMRAAFKAVMDGKQVAVLVPTTVLAQQHYESFCARFARFPVTVDLLSRYRSPADQRATAAAAAAHRVDILVGTHRLLSPDVRFADLGLVVVDEEQRFGVAAKEHLKRLRENVDVLTLSATPIPRTLYLSLSGARDLSVIQTPPRERLPIETLVAQDTDDLLRTVILRELRRGGQVFFLHNRIQTIEAVRRRLLALVPEARIGLAHGQLSERALAAVMRDFVRGRTNLLLCTTIVESGVDIPNVNTILIDRADRFGMAELYQLRGRVGRSRLQAYAYLLLPRHGLLFGIARDRIDAVRKHTSLGAGYKLALRDLELRGAGNLLGAAQSGHVAAVGFELYCQLLRRTVARLRGAPLPPVVDVKVKLDFLPHPSASIPPSFVEDETLRIQLYRQLASIALPADVPALEDEWRDRFGPLPPPVRRLFDLAKIRLLAHALHLQTVATDGDKLMLWKDPSTCLMPNGRHPRLHQHDPDRRLAEIIKRLRSLLPPSLTLPW